jgi:hypothetical protein
MSLMEAQCSKLEAERDDLKQQLEGQAVQVCMCVCIYINPPSYINYIYIYKRVLQMLASANCDGALAMLTDPNREGSRRTTGKARPLGVRWSSR